MDRRSFLQTAGIGLAGGLLPAKAVAAPSVALPDGPDDRRVRAFTDRVRARRNRLEARLGRRFSSSDDQALTAAYARASASVAATEEKE